ncbi:MAG: hypothetical protein JWN10_2572 [Solirubrobacterales bacterium]|nr:hypothetical protein [Solirubrobacterales bacterium]
MTLLQRAPREVYRVFDEDQFLARAPHEPLIATAVPAAAERRLRRIAGTTVLLAATGALGGLLAVASVSSVSGTRRRTGVRLFASTVSSGVLPRPSSHVTGARTVRHLTLSAGPRDAGARQRKERLRVSRRPRPAVRSLVKRRIAAVLSGGRRAPVAIVPEQRSVPVEAVPSASHDPAAVGGSQPRRSGRSEFGFER